MIKRTVKTLKPLALAIVVLVLTPCVVEFVFRVNLCREQLQSGSGSSGLDVSPSWFTHHELDPLQLTTRKQGTSSGPVELRTNSLGLRGPEIDVSKDSGAIRVICLGDEIVLGGAVDEPHLFTQRLQTRLQSVSSEPVEVINAGVPDFCPLLNLLHFRHRLLCLSPDIVIAHFDMSDVWDDHRFRRLTELGPQEQPLVCVNPTLASTPVTRPLTENFASWRWAQNRLADWLEPDRDVQSASVDDPQAKYNWLAEESSLWDLQAELAVSPFDHLAKLCRQQGIRLMLAVHPAPWQLSATASRGARVPEQNGIFPGTLLESRRPQELLSQLATSRGLPLCDAIDAFRKHSAIDELFCETSREFSETGHRHYAVTLSASMQQSFPELFATPPPAGSSGEPRDFAGENDRSPEPLRPAAFSRPVFSPRQSPETSRNRSDGQRPRRSDGQQHRITGGSASVPPRTAERLPNDLAPVPGQR